LDTIVFNKDKFFEGFKNHKYTINNAGINILHDTVFLTKLLPYDSSCSIIDIMSEKFLSKHRDFVEKAVSFFGDNFNHLPVNYRDDIDIANLAIESSNFSNLRLGEKLSNDYNFAREAVSKNGFVLKSFSYDIRSQTSFNILAVKQSPLAYRSLLDKMKANDEVINVAVEQNGFIYHFVPEKNRENNEKLLIKALENSKDYAPLIYKESPVNFRENTDISLLACTQNIECIKNVPFKTFYEEDFQNGLSKIIETGREVYVQKSLQEDDFACVRSYDNYLKGLLEETSKRCEIDQQRYLENKQMEEDFLRETYSEGENLIEE